MRHSYRILVILLASLSLTAGLVSCSTVELDKPRGIAQFKDDPRLGKQVNAICFKGNVDGFSDAAGNTIVLREGINRHYRVSLNGFCPNLEYAQSLAFERQSGCARRGDYILLSDSVFSLDDGTGVIPDRCFINEIYEWDRDALENTETSGG